MMRHRYTTPVEVEWRAQIARDLAAADQAERQCLGVIAEFEEVFVLGIPKERATVQHDYDDALEKIAEGARLRESLARLSIVEAIAVSRRMRRCYESAVIDLLAVEHSLFEGRRLGTPV